MKSLIVCMIVCMALAGCAASTRIMKECKELGQGFYECEEP